MNNSIFRDPEEKGSNEWWGCKEGASVGLLILIAVVVIIITGLVIYNATASESEFPGIAEKDGVLYYPDGNPVRNYEQLETYLNSQ